MSALVSERFIKALSSINIFSLHSFPSNSTSRTLKGTVTRLEAVVQSCSAEDITIMARSLEDCPPEIVEAIVESLPFEDICNVRLSSRSLGLMVAQETYKSHFVTKHVDIRRECLETFIHVTKPGSVGCSVENLVLTGLAFDASLLDTTLREEARWVTERNGPMFSSVQHKCTPEELVKITEDLETFKHRQQEQVQLKNSGQDKALLRKAFSNLATYGKTGSLPSLSLDVIVFRKDSKTRSLPVEGGDWQLIWKTAAYAFHTSMEALAWSRLPIERMDIFHTSLRCSLSCNELSKLDAYMEGLGDSLRALKSLSISSSEGLLNESQLNAGEDAMKLVVTDESNFIGLSNVLGLATNLEELRLHWFNTHQHRLNINDCQHQKFFRRLGESSCLPCLRTVILQGCYVTEDSLLAFLESRPIKSLSMDNVYMREGTFASVFGYVTTDEAGLGYLYFDDLWESQLLYFTGSGSPKFPNSQPTHGGQTLERKGQEVKQPIPYHFPRGRSLGSAQAYKWGMLRRRQYGPP